MIWYDPKSGKYYFKSESDMNGDVVSGDVVSHKLIQDLLSISKWKLKNFGKLTDNETHVSSGGIELNKKLEELALAKRIAKQNVEKTLIYTRLKLLALISIKPPAWQAASPCRKQKLSIQSFMGILAIQQIMRKI